MPWEAPRFSLYATAHLDLAGFITSGERELSARSLQLNTYFRQVTIRRSLLLPQPQMSQQIRPHLTTALLTGKIGRDVLS